MKKRVPDCQLTEVSKSRQLARNLKRALGDLIGGDAHVEFLASDKLIKQLFAEGIISAKDFYLTAKGIALFQQTLPRICKANKGAYLRPTPERG